MPFGKYPTFAACVAQNQDKADPEAYCAAIMHAVEGTAKSATAFDAMRRRLVPEVTKAHQSALWHRIRDAVAERPEVDDPEALATWIEQRLT